MGDKTKIDWADASWNPVTGCLHGCEYCYARRIAKRFDGGWDFSAHGKFLPKYNEVIHVVDAPGKMRDGRKAAYPFGFAPTLRRDRLDIPVRWTNPRNIFVCSMADLFGDWVPEEWILEVMEACGRAPQHRYLFLTKNPARYVDMFNRDKLPMWDNMWYGTSTPTPHDEFFYAVFVNTFVSIEPILAPFTDLVNEGIAPATKCNWIIVGAETGVRKDKVTPEKEWITELMAASKATNTPLFMKDSLRELMGDDFRQEFPWEVKP